MVEVSLAVIVDSLCRCGTFVSFETSGNVPNRFALDGNWARFQQWQGFYIVVAVPVMVMAP